MCGSQLAGQHHLRDGWPRGYAFPTSTRHIPCDIPPDIPPVLYPQTMPLPVVRMTRGSVSMTLVARSVDEYLHRWVHACVLAHVSYLTRSLVWTA